MRIMKKKTQQTIKRILSNVVLILNIKKSLYVNTGLTIFFKENRFKPHCNLLMFFFGATTVLGATSIIDNTNITAQYLQQFNATTDIKCFQNKVQPKNSIHNNAYVDYSVQDSNQILGAVIQKNNKSIYHLFSHGRSGALFIKGQWIKEEEIAAFLYLEFKKQNTPFSHLNIYGCSFAKGEKGIKAVKYLEDYLGITVAASNNITGINGDWKLEIGEPYDLIDIKKYNHNLQCIGPPGDCDGDGVVDTIDLDDDNDGIYDTQEYCATNPSPEIQINIDLDAYEDETTWTLVDPLGGTISSGGPYTSTDDTINFGIEVFTTGTYVFTIKDRFGDGMSINDVSNENANASFTVMLNGATFYSSSSFPNFGNSFTVNINVTYESGGFYCLTSDPSENDDSDSFLNYQDIDYATANGTTLNSFGVLVSMDADNDGIINSFDTDSDNDGCSDANEAYSSNLADGADGPQFGIGDPLTLGAGEVNANGTVSNASATYPNILPDVTNSLVSTICFPVEICGNGVDDDGDGLIDCEDPDCYLVANTGGMDFDADGIDDNCDLDDDNDGILDSVEGRCTSTTSLLQSGTWSITGNTATYNYGGGVLAKVTVTGITTLTSGNFNPAGTGFWTEALQGATSLESLASFHTSFVVNYHDDLGNPITVVDPIIHFDRLGGRKGSTEYSSIITLRNGLTWTKLIGTNDFVATSNTIIDNGCGAQSDAGWVAESTMNIFDGTSAGSLRINGYLSTFTFDINRCGPIEADGADGIEIILSTVACINKDTDGDTIHDYKDTDSDADGCNDADEAYSNINADSDNNGTYGSGVPIVNNQGLVIAAGISAGTYTTIPATTTGGKNTFQEGTLVNITTPPINKTVCEGANVNFTAIATTSVIPTIPATSASTNVIYQWQLSTDGGATFNDIVGETGSIASGANATLTLTGVTMAMNDNKYKVIFTNEANICNDESQATLTIDKLPTVTDQPDQTLCNTTSFTMTQSAPTVGTGSWTLISGTATITDAVSPTTTVSSITAGTSVTVQWTVTNGTCSASDQVVLTNEELPTVTDQPDQTLCNTTSFTMTQSAPTVGTGSWTLISGTATITDAVSPTTTVSSIAAGTSVTVQWTVTNGTCSASDQVVITNQALPTVALNGVPVEPSTCIASDGSIGLSFTNISDGNYTINYALGSFGVITVTGGNAVITGLSSGVYDDINIETIGCISMNNIDVTLNNCPKADDEISTSNVVGTNTVVDILAGDILGDGTQAAPSDITIDLDPNTSGNQATWTIAGEGTWIYDAITGNLTFDPEAGFTTDPTPITYTITEIATGLSDTGLVTIDYTEVNPKADDEISTSNVVGTNTVVDILAGDLLGDGTQATPSDITIDLDPNTSGNQATWTIAGEGTWIYDAITGNLTFDPEAGFTTDPTPITYTITEIATGLSDTGLVTIDYTEVNPKADDEISTSNVVGTNTVVDILTGDLLGDGTQATPSDITIDLDPNTSGNQATWTIAGEGTWIYDAITGNLTFDPEAGFTTDPTPITYTITEIATGLSDTGLVTIDYTEVNPKADDEISTSNVVGTNTVVDILTGDLLGDGTQATPSDITIDLDPNTSGNQATWTIAGEGTWIYDAITGNLTFDPEAGFTTDPTPITYTITEIATGLSDTGLVTIDYTEVNPKGEDDISIGNIPGKEVTINILDNDLLSNGIPVTLVDVTIELIDPQTGLVSITPNTVIVPNEGIWTYNPVTGVLTFEPEIGFKEEATPIDYVLTETITGLSDIGTVVLFNTQINTTYALTDFNNTNVNTRVTGNVLTNDFDIEGDSQLVTTTSVTTTQGITVVIDQNKGEYTYTPPLNFVGNDSFEYTICDNGIPKTCDTATVYLKIISRENDESRPLVANPDTNLTKVDVTIKGNLQSNDYNLGEGELTVNTTAVITSSNGTEVINNDGSYTYTPNKGFVGEDRFTYEICNSDGVCDTAIVTIIILNDGGNITIANDDSYSTEMNTVVTEVVTVNDFDPEGNNQTVTIEVVQGTNNGQLEINANGKFTYTPSNGYIGPDHFVYEICDDGQPKACNKGTVYFIVKKPFNSCLIVYNEFSPNGDGINDTFVIECIENYPKNKLQICGRWGGVFYEKQGYNNDWDGNSNGVKVVSKSNELPVGTYYYVLDLGDGSEPIVGWLYLNR